MKNLILSIGKPLDKEMQSEIIGGTDGFLPDDNSYDPLGLIKT